MKTPICPKCKEEHRISVVFREGSSVIIHEDGNKYRVCYTCTNDHAFHEEFTNLYQTGFFDNLYSGDLNGI